MKLFLFILSWTVLLWWLISFAGAIAQNEDVKNKIYGRKFVVPSWLTLMALLSIANIIYHFVS